MSQAATPIPGDLVEELHRFIEWAIKKNGGSTKANKPGHRTPFHWPPHPVSYSFHVLASDWTGKAQFKAHGEIFEVEVARTPYGVFGRSPALWHDARGDTLEQMLDSLRAAAEPLLKRQLMINELLGRKGRFEGNLGDLPASDLVKLLYCKDRDVANDARILIETQASTHLYGPALVEILRDTRHPDRRSAQWCVLDLFEDIPSFFPARIDWAPALQAIRDLIWNAEDDYARTVYKAGVVLGGHMPEENDGRLLLECLHSPSKIGRRSAIHGLFHVVEWNPETRDKVLDALCEVAESDPDPLLRLYADAMAEDIRADNSDHVAEPVFADEP